MEDTYGWQQRYNSILSNLRTAKMLVPNGFIGTTSCLIKSFISNGEKIKQNMSITNTTINVNDLELLKEYLYDLIYNILDWYMLKYSHLIPDVCITKCRNTFLKKNKDYGNAFMDYILIGVIVRLGDKIKRIDSLTQSTDEPHFESIEDNMLDSFNYCILALMLINL